MPIEIIRIVELVACLVVIVMLFLIGRDTARRRGKWGINFRRAFCPKCGIALPLIRNPRTRRQMKWSRSPFK
jgi:hypothetical protein